MDTKGLSIIGVSGTNGAGKDTVGYILSEQYGYLFVSVTDILRQECIHRNLPVERANLRMISAEWRRQFGLGVLVDKAIEELDKQKQTFKGIVIASLRNPGEANRLHELGGKVIWVDADPKVRYERVRKSSVLRINRSTEDNKTYNQFLAEQAAEMHPSGDEATLNIAGVKSLADISLDNSTDDMVSFRQKLVESLGLEAK